MNEPTNTPVSAPPTSGGTDNNRIMAIASLVLGIINLCAWFFPICGAPLAIGGLALGYFGMEEMIEHLRFKRVIGEVFSFNRATIDFNLRLGFVHEEGRTRQVWKNGQYETILIFDLYPDNWLKRKPELAKLIFAEEASECVR